MPIPIVLNWWSLAIRGVFAILFGILTFAWPSATVQVVVLLFGVYALIDGVVSLAGAWRRAQSHQRWGPLLFEGIAGILAGIAAFVWPGITVVFLVTLIGIWAILTGVLELVAAFHVRRHVANEWLLILTGVVSILFGILLFTAPAFGALTLALWLGIYALVFGVLLLLTAFRLRHWLGSSQAVPGVR